MTRLRSWLAALAVVSVAVVICYLWLDQPIALWVHAHHASYRSRDVLEPLTHIPDPLIPLGAATFFLLGLRAFAGQPPRKIYEAILACAVSVVMAETTKNGLKWMFGRPWPETWKNNNPSFIENHDYAFHWFGGGGVYSSFPSGHTTATLAVVSVLWICYPRWRPLYVVIALAVAIGLIGSNFHFLGDVIAGAFLGATIGWMTVLLCGGAAAQRPRGGVSEMS
jgi:membrane-associated phospholipid phosphatase